jgi:DNA-binding transcriptional regulator GbsR (MarR family)
VTDLWEIFLRIAAGRKEREIDPAVAALKACVAEAEGDPRVGETARQRLTQMLAFTSGMAGWYDQMQAIPKSKLAALFRLGTKILNLLPSKRTT